MRHAILLLGLLASALPAAAARPWPDKPGAALAAIQLPPCDYRTDYWTPVGSLSAKLSEGHHAAVEAELEELHGAFEKNHACENRMKWAFVYGFHWSQELRPALDRWVAARPQAWTAHAVRGLFWHEMLWQARWANRRDDMRDATERAVADLERAAELHPKALVAHAGLLDVYKTWGERARLEEVFARAVAIDPVSVHLHETMLVALDPRWGDDFDRTEAIVAEARRHEQKNPRVARLYGYPDAWRARKLEWTLPRKKSNEDRLRVVVWFTRALRYADAGTDWHHRRAMNYSEWGNHAAAVADADFALAKPEPEERWFILKAYSLDQLGRHDEALATAREGLRRYPGSFDLAYKEADALFELSQIEEAEKLFRAALARAVAPHQRSSHLRGLGSVLLKTERWKEAESAFGEAAAIDETHGFTWHRLAEARWKLGHREDAVRAYERFIELTAGEDWADEMALRAQEKIDLVRSGEAPPTAAVKP